MGQYNPGILLLVPRTIHAFDAEVTETKSYCRTLLSCPIPWDQINPRGWWGTVIWCTTCSHWFSFQVLTLHSHAVLLSVRAAWNAPCRMLSPDQFKAGQLDKNSSATDRCPAVFIPPDLMLTLFLQLRTMWH